jgi:hypothetical protein
LLSVETYTSVECAEKCIDLAEGWGWRDLIP